MGRHHPFAGDVAIRISDHNGHRLALLYNLWGDWTTATDDPEKPDELFSCMLDAGDAIHVRRNSRRASGRAHSSLQQNSLGLTLSQLIERGRQVAEDLGAPAPDKVKATLMALFCRAEIRSDRVDVTLSRGRLTQLLAGSLDLKMQHQAPTSAPDDLLGLTVPVGLKRVGREMRMLVYNANDQTPADPSLLTLIARAHHI